MNYKRAGEQELSDVYKRENIRLALHAAQKLDINMKSIDNFTFLKGNQPLILSFFRQMNEKYPFREIMNDFEIKDYF